MSPTSIEALELTAAKFDCSLEVVDKPRSIKSLRISGSNLQVSRLAEDMALPVGSNDALESALRLKRLSESGKPVSDSDLASTGSLSIYDFDYFAWIDAGQLSSYTNEAVAIKLVKQFGPPKYYVRLNSQLVIVEDGATAIYLAGAKKELCSYVAASLTLTTRTRLPAQYALPLCLCSGRLPIRDPSGAEKYENVTTGVADLVLSSLSQRIKKIYWL